MGNPKVSGFTLVRNAMKLDYPFEASVRSVLPLCDEFWINCGDSNDGTREMCVRLQAEFPDKIHIFDTVWSTVKQAGGQQLRDQTDAALAKCSGDWCLYIQADECLHEADYDRLRMAMKRGDARSEVDGVVFDYLHFYGSYDYTIRGRNWYRREVRLFKNHRGIRAFRDAQGFRQASGERLRAISSGANVYHYGYVRDGRSLVTKGKEMATWWGSSVGPSVEEVPWVRHVGIRRFEQPHPREMHGRIKSAVSTFDPARCPRKWDVQEFKNALTILWDRLFNFRLGEFRNYELVDSAQ